MSFNREMAMLDRLVVNELHSIGNAGAADLAVSATPKFPLGTRKMVGGKEYMYCEADVNIALNAWVAVHADYGLDPLDTDDATTIERGKEVGIAVAAMTASTTKFGWVAIRGHGISGLSADQAAGGVRQVPTSAAGTIDDLATGGTGAMIVGAAAEGAITGGTGLFTLCYPTLGTDLLA